MSCTKSLIPNGKICWNLPRVPPVFIGAIGFFIAAKALIAAGVLDLLAPGGRSDTITQSWKINSF